MGKRGRLLIEALQDATEARRRSNGGSKRDYAKQLKVGLYMMYADIVVVDQF